MKIHRYVEFVTEISDWGGKRKATRRMSQRSYIIKTMLLHLIAALVGAVVGIKIWSEW